MAIQCILFYLPKLIWKQYCIHWAGADWENLLIPSDSFLRIYLLFLPNLLKDLVNIIETLFFLNRDHRRGIISDIKRKISQKVPLQIYINFMNK